MVKQFAISDLKTGARWWKLWRDSSEILQHILQFAFLVEASFREYVVPVLALGSTAGFVQDIDWKENFPQNNMKNSPNVCVLLTKKVITFSWVQDVSNAILVRVKLDKSCLLCLILTWYMSFHMKTN